MEYCHVLTGTFIDSDYIWIDNNMVIINDEVFKILIKNGFINTEFKQDITINGDKRFFILFKYEYKPG